jgi:hypothetical protein
MKKRIIEVQAGVMEPSDFEGEIDKVIDRLVAWKREAGVIRIQEHCPYSDERSEFILWKRREETDEEYEARMYEARKKRENAKKSRRTQRERELAELARLQKKYAK